MSPKTEDDWSDSDDDGISEVETSVLLGVPDGPVDGASDIIDAAVSRIGGHPVRYISFFAYSLRIQVVSISQSKAFLPSREPPMSSSSCKLCSNAMELLVQMWCPVEDSPHDRALYIWGCARGSCQKKDGW